MVTVNLVKRTGRKYFQAVWRDPISKQEKTRSTKCTKRRDAERFAIRLEVELANRTGEDLTSVSWAEFRRRYETEVLPTKADATGNSVRGVFKRIEKLITPKKPSDLAAPVISRYAAELRATGLSEFTVKSHLSIIRRVLSWGLRQGYITAMPLIEMPSPRGAKARAITSDEFERLLKAVPEVVGENAAASWKFLLRGLWWSGLRLGEALNLHWIDDRDIRVNLEGRFPMFRIQPHAEKARRFRMLPMAPEFAEMLETVSHGNRFGFVFDPIPFQKIHIGRLRKDYVSKAIAKIGERAEIIVGSTPRGPKFASAHDLRRAFGVRWSKRVSAPTLMEMMRHESIETTQEFYIGKNAETAAGDAWKAFRNDK